MSDSKLFFSSRAWSRRRLLQAGGAVAASLGGLRATVAAAPPPMTLPKLLADSEHEAPPPPPALPPEQRMGFAIVGLGHLALGQVLPAFAQSRRARPTALVSGDRAKATKVAGEYGISAKSLYDYKTFDRLRDDKTVDAVYIALPNSLHAEFTVRAAEAGKHVLCEKPMATSVADGERMIAACAKAGKQLMIAYRMQYEPYNREAIRMARAGELGHLKAFSALNCQDAGDPHQWRLKKALAGGGPLPDLGIYCLNAARYLTGEEPVEVAAMLHATPNDPRFVEVEEQVDFMLRFPSGLQASCTTSYGCHDNKRYRLMGDAGWLELDPAFPYQGQQLRVSRAGRSGEDVVARRLDNKNQFALELDHFAERAAAGKKACTPGEEGLQDVRLIAAIYEAARKGASVKLPAVAGRDAFRGPAV
jgi:predicted dehydrogenase